MFDLILLLILLSGMALFLLMSHKSQKKLNILALKANQQASPRIRANAEKPVLMDRLFLVKAVKNGIYGLLLGALGIEKSQNPEVKAFALDMVQEHQIMNMEIIPIARRKGIGMPESLDPDQKNIMRNLSQLSGSDFDSSFLAAALEEHRDELSMCEGWAMKDKDLQGYISHAVPKLKIHIKLGKKVLMGRGLHR
jgi:predicted outer membrane protein